MLERIRKIFVSKGSYEAFFDVVGRYWPKGSDDYVLIERAYSTAEVAFAERERDNGERYFEHLRSVALVLMVYLRVRDANLIAAALLHDIIEDIEGWSQERIAAQFNQTIAQLVWWVSKQQVNNFNGDKAMRNRAYHEKLGRAPREACIIKLADRLHNLLTLWDWTIEDQKRKVSETQDFYLPIAYREILLIHELEAAINELALSWKTVQA
jgi:GTP diphosphokinase / guanosine-3',5'-bis(diphosphate) 3'-diphosphatase